MKSELSITIENTDDNEQTLLDEGYLKRNGSGFNHRGFIVIIPSKKWYWLSSIGILGLGSELIS